MGDRAIAEAEKLLTLTEDECIIIALWRDLAEHGFGALALEMHDRRLVLDSMTRKRKR